VVVLISFVDSVGAKRSCDFWQAKKQVDPAINNRPERRFFIEHFLMNKWISTDNGSSWTKQISCCIEVPATVF
jgi:hypothetical protein